ncbi:MAG TPA: nitrogen fixation protein NifZ, partial [Burkholderiaceae bacterium]
VDFVDSGHRVGMRAKELCTLDNLPQEVLAQLGDKVARLKSFQPANASPAMEKDAQ